jgi:hypothetical protein
MIKKIAYVLFLLSSKVLANDGFGELGVGGIVLDKSQDILIKSEVLDISYSEIAVAYEFQNDSEKAVSTTISFPLPGYSSMPEVSGVLYQGQPDDFAVEVNGKKRPYKTKVQAVADNKDITELLLASGLSDADIVAMPFRINAQKTDYYDNGIDPEILSAQQIEKLRENGLIDERFPRWQIFVTYVWDYTFEPKSITNVRHRYRPFIATGTWGMYDPEYAAEKIEQYCIDKKLEQKLKRLYQAGVNVTPYRMIDGTQLEYVLKTATSWKGAIKEFTLRLHKGHKSEYISLCFPGDFKKVNDLTLETKLYDFVPVDDLKVLFLNASPNHGSNGNIPALSNE